MILVFIVAIIMLIALSYFGLYAICFVLEKFTGYGISENTSDENEDEDSTQV